MCLKDYLNGQWPQNIRTLTEAYFSNDLLVNSPSNISKNMPLADRF